MKVLHIFPYTPHSYLKNLSVLQHQLKESIGSKILSYQKGDDSDYVVISYGFRDLLYRILYKIKLSRYKSLDIKYMNQFDLVHVQISYLYNKVLPLLRQKHRPKVIITLRGGDTYIKPWVNERWSDFYRTEAQQIDAFVTMSENQKQYLTRWGIDPAKIFVIPVSFGQKFKVLPKFPGKGKLQLVSAFRMTWEKNIEGTVRFAMLLKQNGVNFKFDIFGDGEETPQLMYLINRYNLNEEINVKGAVDNNYLKKIFLNYDFMVQISISDALPASVLEAQSNGLPVIVSNSDGLPEAVIPNVSAIVSDYYNLEYFVNECLRIWSNEDVYFGYSKAAIDYSHNNFSVDSEENKYVSLYRKILSA